MLRYVLGVAIPLYITPVYSQLEAGPWKLQHTECDCPGPGSVKMSFVQSSAAAEGLKELGQELLGLVTVLRWGWWKLG